MEDAAWMRWAHSARVGAVYTAERHSRWRPTLPLGQVLCEESYLTTTQHDTNDVMWVTGGKLVVLYTFVHHNARSVVRSLNGHDRNHNFKLRIYACHHTKRKKKKKARVFPATLSYTVAAPSCACFALTFSDLSVQFSRSATPTALQFLQRPP